MNEKENQVKEALQFLAGVCDYAEELDGQGFNAFDAGFGHSLAEQSAYDGLSENQINAALKLLQKYRKQIERKGLTLPKLDETKPIKKESKPTSIKINGMMIMIDFHGKPNREIREEIKTLDGWQWNPSLPGKPWSVPTKHAGKIIEMFPDAEIDKEVVEFSEWLKTNGKADV